MTAGFTFYQDSAREWRWRLKDDNGQTVAVSGEGYQKEDDAHHAAKLFTALGPEAKEHKKDKGNKGGGQGPEWEYFMGENSQWYWHFQAANNRNIAFSGEGYDSESNAQRAIANVKALLKRLKNENRGGFDKPSSGGPVTGGRFA